MISAKSNPAKSNSPNSNPRISKKVKKGLLALLDYIKGKRINLKEAIENFWGHKTFLVFYYGKAKKMAAARKPLTIRKRTIRVECINGGTGKNIDVPLDANILQIIREAFNLDPKYNISLYTGDGNSKPVDPKTIASKLSKTIASKLPSNILYMEVKQDNDNTTGPAPEVIDNITHASQKFGFELVEVPVIQSCTVIGSLKIGMERHFYITWENNTLDMTFGELLAVWTSLKTRGITFPKLSKFFMPQFYLKERIMEIECFMKRVAYLVEYGLEDPFKDYVQKKPESDMVIVSVCGGEEEGSALAAAGHKKMEVMTKCLKEYWRLYYIINDNNTTPIADYGKILTCMEDLQALAYYLQGAYDYTKQKRTPII